MTQKANITIIGAGYVGTAVAALLARAHKVVLMDIDAEKVAAINEKRVFFSDDYMAAFMAEQDLDLSATADLKQACASAEHIIIALPTDYDAQSHVFDTSYVDEAARVALAENENALIVIKSTVPVGHTKTLCQKLNTDRIIIVPEFLREGMALYDNLHPSRIIIGGEHEKAKTFAALLAQGADKKDIRTLYMDSDEAEAVKLFANTYLAMRVSFFNELDSYAMANGLATRAIIEGVCLDERIGDGYNNPSFGYGGYCLPKDTQQLLANYEAVPQNLIQAIVQSNDTRKHFITQAILDKAPRCVGIYRLVMKKNSDNFRQSSVQSIMKQLAEKNIPLLIYEPLLAGAVFEGVEVVHDLADFKTRCDVIVANRVADELADVSDKIFTRDLFGNG